MFKLAKILNYISENRDCVYILIFALLAVIAIIAVVFYSISYGTNPL